MAGNMEVKLDKLISEVTVLPLIMSNISELVKSFQSFQNMFTTLDNRINNVKASHQDLIETVEASLQTRINTLEASFENRLRNVEFNQGNSINSVDPSDTEERNSLKNDVAELSTLMDTHCKDNWEFEEAVRLFPTVTRNGMKNMAAKLSSSLKNGLSVVNCIQVFQLASQYEMDDLWEASKEWISKNFVVVSQTIDFWKLTVDEMCVFVYSDTLCCKQEDVFNAISKWVNHDRIHRTAACSVLLNAVQFHQCTVSFLQNILDHHYLVFVNSDVQFSIEEAIKRKTEEQDNTICTSATKDTERKDVLFVLGGFSDTDSIIEAYNAVQCTWKVQTQITNSPSKRTHALTAGHQILVLEEDNKKFRSFNTLTKEWNDLRPLPVFRIGMSSAMEGNELFLMGGGSGQESRCDVYDMQLDTWSEGKSLNVGRLWSASSSLKGKVYCSGGQSSSGQYLSSMEVFDPKEKTKGWTLTTSMKVSRGYHCLVSCGQYLWSVGGHDGSNYLRDLDRFEPRTNTWTKMSSMPTGRHELTACFFGGRLFAIGGWNGNYLNMVELYDPGENRWTTGASLNNKRCWHASCVVKEMSNADEFQ